MPSLRKALALCALGLWGLGTLPAAACEGRDLLPDLRAEDPAAVEAMFANAHAILNGQGRFWQVARAGDAPSYLFGTFHSAEAIETLTDDIFAAFDCAARVVVEIDLEQKDAMQARMATDPLFSYDPSAVPLSTRLTPEQLQSLEQALVTRGMTLEMAEQMRPWLLASLLGFPVCHLQMMAAGEEPLDVVLARRAEARGAPVLGLEGYEDAIAAFRAIDREMLLASIASSGKMIAHEEDIFRTNARLYAAGEITAIGELGILLAEREDPEADNRAIHNEVMSRLLDRRNALWMTRLIPALQGGGTFVAVGALHLPGASGLIERLRAEGFTVTRLDE